MKRKLTIITVVLLITSGVIFFSNVQTGSTAEYENTGQKDKSSQLTKKNTPLKSPKGRRHISPWFRYRDEKSIKELIPHADIIASISIFGKPTPQFIANCRKLNIETYLLVSGNASAFDTPQHARATIQSYLKQCRGTGLDGIDLDFENLDAALQNRYSAFLKELSRQLHRAGKKLSICVGFYPPMHKRPPENFFYDPKVVGETCDMIRVMCYDMYWAPGKGIGPTSTKPWAKDAMKFWLKHVPREKLIMGLPAYSNDYDLTPDAKGKQVTSPKPVLPESASFERVWLPYEQIHTYRYLDDKGHVHLFFASDADSTRAHLATVDELDIPGIAFWYYQAVTPQMWETVRNWHQRAPQPTLRE